MDVFPREVWMEIFKYMDFISVLNVAALSGELASALCNEYFHDLVQHLFDEDFHWNDLIQPASVFHLLTYNTHVAVSNPDHCIVPFMHHPLYNVFLLNYRCCVTLKRALGKEPDVLERDQNLKLVRINWAQHRHDPLGRFCKVLLRLIAIFPEFIDVTSSMVEHLKFGKGPGALGIHIDSVFPQCIIDDQRKIEYTGLFVSQWDARPAYAFAVFILENYFYIWTGQLEFIIQYNERTLGYCKCEHNITFSDMKRQTTPVVHNFLEQVKYSWYGTYNGFTRMASLYATDLEPTHPYFGNLSSPLVSVDFMETSIRASQLRSLLGDKLTQISEKIATKCEKQLNIQKFSDRKCVLNFFNKIPCSHFHERQLCGCIQQKESQPARQSNESFLFSKGKDATASNNCRAQNNVLKVSILRCLHRLINWLFMQECLEYINDLTCHGNLCQNCSYITAGTNHDNLSLHHLPPKVWPLHLLVMAEHLLPIIGKLLQLDIMLNFKNKKDEKPKNVQEFITKTLVGTDLTYIGNNYPMICMSVEIPSQVSALNAFHVCTTLPLEQNTLDST